jgi:hypothetical protein
MELFCPNCQKKLLIEDRYAGQVMKCPMCSGTFTAPSLPTFSTSAPPSPPAPPPPGPAPLPPTTAPPSAPSGAAPETAPAPPPPPVRGTEHEFKFHIWLSPKVLQWVPVGALFLIFVLSFFTWVWVGYGSLAVAAQNGWQASFGLVSVDKDLKGPTRDEDQPGISVLTLLYLLWLLPTLALAAVAAAILMVPIQLPPQIQMLLMWRWAIVAAAVLLGLLLLGLQLLVGFSLENKVRSEVNAEISRHSTDIPSRSQEMARQLALSSLHRAWPLGLVFWLQMIALVIAALLFLIDFRKTAPIPRIDVLW